MILISGNNLSRHTTESLILKKDYGLYVNSCGYQKFISRDFSIERPSGTPEYQIIYIIRGKGYFRLEDKETVVNQGEFIIYRPYEPQFYRYCFEDLTELYWIHFTGYGADSLLQKSDILNKPIHSVGVQNEYIELFKKIIDELQKKRPASEEFSSAFLQELLAHFARVASSLAMSANTYRSSDIEKVIALIHSSYNQKYSNKYYAQACNLSLFRFIHKFKECTGMTPLEYIIHIRINEAKYLLSFSSLSISKISAIIGYENPLYFSRVFARETGSSPSLFRANSR